MYRWLSQSRCLPSWSYVVLKTPKKVHSNCLICTTIIATTSITTFTLKYLHSSNFLIVISPHVNLLCISVEMDQNCSCVSGPSTSYAPSTQDDPIFPNYQFVSQTHTKKCLKLKNYNIACERAFGCLNLEGYKALIKMLE